MKIIWLALSLMLVSNNAFCERIWFSPNNPDILEHDSRYSSWSEARENINVYKFYYQVILLSPAWQLRDRFRFLKSHNIKVAVEYPGLSWVKNGRGYNKEGFQDPGFTDRFIEKLKEVGEPVDIIALDEPLYFGSVENVSDSARMSIHDTVKNLNSNLSKIHRAYPNTEFGTIEPFDMMTSDYKKNLTSFLSEFKNQSGYKLSFVHYDVVWDRDWRSKVPILADISHRYGARFGVIFNSINGDGPDWRWMLNARRNVLSYFLTKDKLPDDAIFQSWNKYPLEIVPDSDNHAHSSLILYYLTEKRIRH